MSEVVAGKEGEKQRGKQKPGAKQKPADKQADTTAGKQPDAKAERAAPRRPSGPARLHQYYREQVVPRLRAELKLDNVMQVPRIRKITVNMGVGEAVADKKVMDAALADLTKITGQKPLITKSRKAIASFKLRAGLAVGAKVTLRGTRMYEFLDRLINVALPRVRDFRGVPPKGFDGRGNYALGLREQLIFPEIVYDKVDKVRGMDINIVTTARTDEDAKVLLTHLGMPFRE